MSTRRLIDGDWTFGHGTADYLTKSEEIQQNIQTRLKSFKNDWFLDTESNIDWFTILGNYNNEEIIRREIERVTLETSGVKTITEISIVIDSNRQASITLGYTDVFNETFLTKIGIL